MFSLRPQATTPQKMINKTFYAYQITAQSLKKSHLRVNSLTTQSPPVKNPDLEF